MPATTSLKLPDALKATIAEVALREGKTAHALMVDSLQLAMDDAVQRHAVYAQGEAAYRQALHSNQIFRAEDVKAYIMARVQGEPGELSRWGERPLPVALDTAQYISWE